MQLVLLAAGRGSRLPKKFRNKPKCLSLIGKKTIFEFNKNFFNRIKNKLIITGFKNLNLQTIIKENNFKEIKNKNYKKTNMVHSLMLSSKHLKKNKDIIVCYGDIIFDEKLFNIFKKFDGNIMPGNKNWFKYWRKRMNINKLLKDAENFKIKKGYLQEIGTIINNQIPKLQYMGIFKITYNSFIKMHKLYMKISNEKIDMTSFLNMCIKKKTIKIKVKNYSSYWYEIDSLKDIKVATKDIK